MIAHILGEVVDKEAASVIVDVSGVGYEIKTTQKVIDSCNVGESVKFYTYFAVRENAQDLYGFTSKESKRLFELLLSVSGVGPKVAISIAGLGEPGEVKSAIASSNVAYVQSANGVGKRGAEKVIVELKDKVGAIGEDSFILDGLSAGDDAAAGLVALGYSQQQANQALAKVDASLSPEERITTALKELSR